MREFQVRDLAVRVAFGVLEFANGDILMPCLHRSGEFLGLAGQLLGFAGSEYEQARAGD